jgi:hypothetical protein
LYQYSGGYAVMRRLAELSLGVDHWGGFGVESHRLPLLAHFAKSGGGFGERLNVRMAKIGGRVVKTDGDSGEQFGRGYI